MNANSIDKSLVEGRNTDSIEKSLGDHLNPVLDVNMSSVLYGHHMYDMMWQGAPHLRSAVPSNPAPPNHKEYSSELRSTVLWRAMVGVSPKSDETDNPPKKDQRWA